MKTMQVLKAVLAGALIGAVIFFMPFPFRFFFSFLFIFFGFRFFAFGRWRFRNERYKTITPDSDIGINPLTQHAGIT